MHAILLEVDLSGTEREEGLKNLRETVVPRVTQAPGFQSGIWGAPTCLDWPVDPTAGSPLEGRRIPDVPVLVQSGDLDTNTPIDPRRENRGASGSCCCTRCTRSPYVLGSAAPVPGPHCGS